jgi:predicted DNA-binding transcriptional regulator AlpA
MSWNLLSFSIGGNSLVPSTDINIPYYSTLVNTFLTNFHNLDKFQIKWYIFNMSMNIKEVPTMTDEKEFLTLSEAAEAVGLKRASLYYYLEKLHIETHRFPYNRHRYIASSDVERIKNVKDSPWKLGGETKEDAA